MRPYPIFFEFSVFFVSTVAMQNTANYAFASHFKIGKEISGQRQQIHSDGGMKNNFNKTAFSKTTGA